MVSTRCVLVVMLKLTASPLIVLPVERLEKSKQTRITEGAEGSCENARKQNESTTSVTTDVAASITFRCNCSLHGMLASRGLISLAWWTGNKQETNPGKSGEVFIGVIG